MTTRDDARFADFVAARQQRLRRAAYLLTGDREAAADVTQEALIRLYVAWPRLDPEQGLVSYAHRALMSAVIDASRRRGTRERYERRVATTESVADGTEQQAVRDAVVRALAAVPVRQRMAVVLRYYDELSVAETAAAMRCSPGTVKSQTARGLEALRLELARHGDFVGADGVNGADGCEQQSIGQEAGER